MKIENFKKLLEEDGYWKHLGIRIKKAEPGYAELTIPLRKELTHYYNLMHGGSLASLLDASVYVSMILLMEHEKESATTIELKINYLRPVEFTSERLITSYTRTIKKGKSVAVGICEIKDGNKLVAIGTATYALLHSKQLPTE